MKRTSLILIAVFAMVMLPFAFAQSTTPSQDPSQQPSAQPSPGTPSSTQAPDSQAPSSSSQSSSSASSTSSQNSFTGSIAKDSNGKFVLHAAGTDYQLDDQSQAKKYDGKSVKVTGQLDQSSNTIRVQSIEPASSM